jgi:hypothetical protein
LPWLVSRFWAMAPNHAGAVEALQQRRHTRADIADHRGGNGHVAVDFGWRNIDLHELLRLAPGFAFAVRQQPVQARADQHHHIGLGQHIRARCRCALRVRVRQEALGHRHWQIRDAGAFDQCADVGVGLRISRALAKQDQRLFGAGQQRQRAVNSVGRGNLARHCIDHLDQRPFGMRHFDGLRKQLGRQVEVDAAWTARDGCTNRPRYTDADVFHFVDPVGGLGVRPGGVQLVHLFVVALLQIDDFALARTRNQDHRKAVGGGVGQRRQAVQETGRGYRQADARLLRDVASNGRCVAGVLLVPEADEAQAFGLRQARQVSDRNTDQPENGVDVVFLECIDHEVEAVGDFYRLVVRHECLQLFSCPAG